MNILIITGSLDPTQSRFTRRWYSWAKYWTLAEHTVTIVSPEQKGGSTFLPIKDPVLSRCQLITVPLQGWRKTLQESAFTPFLKSLIKPTIPFLDPLKPFSKLWVKPALSTLKEHRAWDCMISTSHLFSTHLIAHTLKAYSPATKWILDLPKISSKEEPSPPYASYSKVETFLTQKVIGSANLITLSNPELIKLLKKTYPKEKIETISESFDAAEYDHLKEKPIFPKDKKYRIVYSGAINLKRQNFEPLFQAVYSIASQHEYRLLIKNLRITFDTEENSELRALITRYSLDQWVKIKPAKSRARSLMKIRDAHALLYYGRSSPEVPSEQLLESLFSKTAILAIGRPLHPKEEEILMQNKAGISLHNNIDEIRSYLLKNLTIRPNKKHLISGSVMKPFTSKKIAHQILKRVSEKKKSKVLSK